MCVGGGGGEWLSVVFVVTWWNVSPRQHCVNVSSSAAVDIEAPQFVTDLLVVCLSLVYKLVVFLP